MRFHTWAMRSSRSWVFETDAAVNKLHADPNELKRFTENKNGPQRTSIDIISGAINGKTVLSGCSGIKIDPTSTFITVTHTNDSMSLCKI